MSWYSNPWVVGIIGSIPGGFLVNWLTGLLLGKKENREYLQKVLGANREVVYAIRPGISEGEIPSPGVMNALRNATARRYGVDPSDLYSAPEIAEELTKEVMDSSFISSSQKHEYCQRLSALVQDDTMQPIDEAVDAGTRRLVTAEYRDRLISTMGMLLGVLTVTITAMISLLELLRSKNFGSILPLKEGKGFEFLIPLLATTGTLVLSTATLPLLRELSKRKRRDRDNDADEELKISVNGVRISKSRDDHPSSTKE